MASDRWPALLCGPRTLADPPQVFALRADTSAGALAAPCRRIFVAACFAPAVVALMRAEGVINAAAISAQRTTKYDTHTKVGGLRRSGGTERRNEKPSYTYQYYPEVRYVKPKPPPSEKPETNSCPVVNRGVGRVPVDYEKLRSSRRPRKREYPRWKRCDYC